MKKKVLFQINSSCNRGSTGRIAELIGRKAKEIGLECYIAYGRHFLPTELHPIKIGNTFYNGVHMAASRIMDNHGLLSIEPTKQLVSEMKAIKPDIVHLHNIHGYYINYKILFEYLIEANMPVVWTLHDCWPFTGHCCHFEFVGCDRWKTGCYKCPGLSVYPKSHLMDKSRRNYALKKELFTGIIERLTIVPVSEWLEGLVKKSFLKDANIETIHNGVDTTVFRVMEERSPKLPEGKKIVLAVASVWDSKKGYDDLSKISKKLPEDYQMVVVGLSAKQVKALPPSIIGIERTDSVDQLASIYSTADVYINPTYEDNFPTTNLEALACGTPVITYSTGGSAEAINAETGASVKQGDIEGLCEAIKKFSSIDRSKIKILCRKRVLDNFEMNNCYSKYIDLYESL